MSWTTHADLATAAAAILSQEGRFEGPTPPMTALEAFDLAGIAAVLSTGGHRVERRVIADADYAGTMARNRVPSPAIDITMGMYRAARAGEFATADPTLAALIGRTPATARDVVAG